MPSANGYTPKDEGEMVTLYPRVSSLELRDEGTISV